MRSRFFREEEFACKCWRCAGAVNTGGGMDWRLVRVLSRIRRRVGRPVVVLSGYRCAAHNAEVGGQPQSLHMVSCAADITIEGIDVGALARLAEECGADGIGTYGAQGFVHVDTRGSMARWDERDYG